MDTTLQGKLHIYASVNCFVYNARKDESTRGSALLIHGLTGSVSDMEGLAVSLSERGFNVIVPELPGHSLELDSVSQIRASEWELAVNTSVSFAKETFAGQNLLVVGLSLGAVLALQVALKGNISVGPLVLVSCPWAFRKTWHEQGLRLLSRLPEPVIDFLPWSAKPEHVLDSCEITDPLRRSHSVGAGARLVGLRQKVRGEISKLRSEVLVVGDPLDYLLEPGGFFTLMDEVPSACNVDIQLWPGGGHALLVGVQSNKVIDHISDWVCSKTGS